MLIEDLYGFADTDIEVARVSVERALATTLVASYSTYLCGDYYYSDLESLEECILQRNFDAVEQEWMEESFQAYTILLYITTATIDRADEVKQLFMLHAPAATHLQRDSA